MENPTEEKKPFWTPTFIMLVIATFFTSTYNIGLSGAIPVYWESIGGDAAFSGFLVAIFMVVSSVMRLICGDWNDRYDQAKLARGGCLVTLFSAVLPVISQDPIMLIASRLIGGLGYAVIITTLIVVVAEVVPEERLGEALGYRSLAPSLAQAVGPGIGVVFIGWGGGTAMFAGFLVSLALGSALVFLAKIPRKNIDIAASSREDKEKDVPALVLEEDPNASPLKRLAHRYICVEALPMALAEMLRTIGLGSCGAFMMIYAMDQGIENAAIFFAWQTAIMVALRLVGGKLLNTNKARLLLVVSFGIGLAGFALLTVAPNSTTYAIAALASGFMGGVAMPYLNALSMKVIPRERYGIANGNFYLAGDLGLALGSLVAGIVVSAFGSFSLMILLLACTLCPLIVSLTLIPKEV